MNKFLLAASALFLGLTLTGAADAAEHHGNHGRVIVRAPFRPSYAVRFGGGYYYRAHEHPQWERCVWDARCNRYQYYDPYGGCYYYFDAARGGYYPVGQ